MVSWKLKSREYRPIGLDFGHNCIKMIQLEVNGSFISVVDAAKVSVAPDINGDREKRKEFITSAVKRLLTEGNFKGREVVLSMPNDELRITSLRTVQRETERIEEILTKEVTNRFDLEPEKDIVNYMLAGSVYEGDEVKNEYILFALKDQVVREHIDMLEKADLKPVGIDPIPCALYRSFSRVLRRQEDREQTEVFIDVGSRSSTLVLGRGCDINFVKNIQIGTENFNQEIAKRLGIEVSEAEMLRKRLLSRNRKPIISTSEKDFSKTDDTMVHQEGLDASTCQIMIDAISSVAEELAKEISLCFRYYTVLFRGKRVERATFTGGGAYENILLNVLKRRMALSIEVAGPFNGIDITRVNFNGDRRGLLCEWAVAVGLGLKGWKPNEVIKANVAN